MQRLRHLLGFWAFVGFVAAYVGILSGAMFYYQFGVGELPCPLCILQRMGMMLSSLGAVYVLVHSLRGQLSSKHFTTGVGLAILGAVLGGMMSFRQIELHLAPGDPGYGEAVLGLHLYSWAIITFIVVIMFSGAMLVFGNEFQPVAPRAKWARTLAWVVIWAFIVTIALNMVVVFAEEGFNWYLPDDPTRYQLFG